MVRRQSGIITPSGRRLHSLQGRMSGLSSVSINISYLIVIEFIIEGDEILLVNIGKHDRVPFPRSFDWLLVSHDI